jgi:23S rRNA (uridine2552-2'-O)-methyltransferase
MYRHKDAYYARAKRDQYRSRAAYKLLELHRRYRLFAAGDRVVDLGAAPGAWLQVAAGLVGAHGRVVGVDIVPIVPFDAPNVVCLVADILAAPTREAVLAALGGPPTVVLSDMAPKLSGIRPRDEAASAELAHAALELATATLAAGGRMVVKVIAGTDPGPLGAFARARFRTAKLTRPEATRKGSTESYLVATDFKGR